MPELKISLTHEQLRLLRRVAAQQQLTPEELAQRALCEHLQLPSPVSEPDDPLPLWRRNEEELIPLLESADSQEQQRAKEVLQLRGTGAFDALEQGLIHPSPVVRHTVAELIVESDSILALRPLLIVYSQAEAVYKAACYQELETLLGHYPQLPDDAWRAIRFCTLRTAPLVARQLKTSLALPLGPKDELDPRIFRDASTSAEIASLTALLRWQRTGEAAKLAALALHQIALAHPVPALRQALPYLHRAWHIRFAHPELIQARKAIEDATVQWKDLPILAESDTDSSGRGLPVPVDNSP
jgi:hypothetical protein